MIKNNLLLTIMLGLFLISFISAVDTSNNVGTYDIAVPITLDSVNITFDVFYFNNSAYVYVSPLDNDKKIVNITNITISLIGDVQYEEGQIIKLEDGRYKKAFTIFNQNISEFTVEVSVKQNLKTIDKNMTVQINEESFLNKITSTAKDIFLQCFEFFKAHWIIIIIIVIVILSAILTLIAEND